MISNVVHAVMNLKKKRVSGTIPTRNALHAELNL